jgi:hypothetical protein
MNDYYIYFDEIPRDAYFTRIEPDKSVIIERLIKYDIVRDRASGEDIGLVRYNRSTPLGFQSHRNNVAWVFWSVGSLCNRTIRAFFKIPNGETIILTKDGVQRNDLKMRVS